MYKKATKLGAYVGFIVATIVVLALKYKLLNVDVSIWAYSLITIVVTVVVGIIVSLFSKEKNEYNTN